MQKYEAGSKKKSVIPRSWNVFVSCKQFIPKTKIVGETFEASLLSSVVLLHCEHIEQLSAKTTLKSI